MPTNLKEIGGEAGLNQDGGIVFIKILKNVRSTDEMKGLRIGRIGRGWLRRQRSTLDCRAI